MNLARRTTMFRFVPSVIPIYLLVTMNVPKWVIKAIVKSGDLSYERGEKKLTVGAAWWLGRM